MSRSSLFGLQPAPRVPPGNADVASWYTPGWSDRFGDRLLMFDNTTAVAMELLRFRDDLDHPAFEAGLRDRVDVLRSLGDDRLSPARSIRRLGEHEGLALVSTQVVGRRLSEMLYEAKGAGFAADLLAQLTPAIAALHAHAPGLCHGTIAAGRVLVTPTGQLVITEAVLSGGLAAMQVPAARLREEFGLAVQDSGLLDAQLDLKQLGLLGLGLLLGRLVPADTPASELGRLLDEQSALPWGPAYPHLRGWLARALHLDPPFDSAAEAAAAVRAWPGGELRGHQSTRIAHATHMSLMSADSPRSRSLHPADPDDGATRDRHQADDTDPEGDEFEFGEVSAAPASAHAFPAERPSAALPPPVRSPSPALSPVPLPVPSPAPTPTEAPPASKLHKAVFALALVEAVVIVALGWMLVRQWRTVPASPPVPAATNATPAAPNAAAAVVGTPVATPTPGVADALQSGRVEIASEPAGARVAIDGTPRGTTPVTVTLPPGEHTIVLTSGQTVTRRTVTVGPGSTSTLMASMGPLGSAGGFVAFDTPLDLQVSEGGNLLGTTRASRLMLPAGTHRLELTNTALGVQDVLTVDVEAGRTVSARIPVPNGVLSLNALPWANVWLDGQPLGTTPIANLTTPVGQHEVLWRHPQFGERRQTVIVQARTPARVVVDLTK